MEYVGRLDSKNRVRLPKWLLDALELKAGDIVKVEVERAT